MECPPDLLRIFASDCFCHCAAEDVQQPLDIQVVGSLHEVAYRSYNVTV